ncbi:Ldh family oxidoreductase [Nocardioides sp. NPDC126508]
MTLTAHPDRLTDFGAEVLASLGVPQADARLVSDSLVTADLWGHPSHGMLRLPWYVARLRSGVMSAVTREEIVVDTGALAVMDGRDGVGQVITDRATRAAVTRAAVHGVGVVAVRNSNHFGTAAYWTRRMAEAGCVGILTTNGSPAMAPWGGTEKTVGANPWSVATPGGSNPPVVLDIANTGVARGKIYAAAERGEPIPDTWAFDADGVSTTDPHTAIHGLLAPMGGHKGYGISFVMDVLSGVLTGSGYGTGVVGPYVPDRRSGCGHLVVAIRVNAVLPGGDFGERIDDLIAATKSVPLATGVEEIFYPGEIEARAEARGRLTGVRLPDKTVTDLRGLGAGCGVAFDDSMLEQVAG